MSSRPTSKKKAKQATTRGAPRVLLVCALLVLGVFLVFGQTYCYDFVNYDDPQYIYENTHIKHGLSIAEIGWAMTANHASNWHPLTWFSHIVDYRLYHLWPGGHHLTNVLLHAAGAVVLFLLLVRMTGRFWPSAAVAALFAIHPLRVESVAWISERKDVLSGLFFLLTLWAYLAYVRRRPSAWRYLAVVVLFALGLMSKPMLVTLPFVLLLLDYWPLGRMITVKPRPMVAARDATNGRGFTEKIGYLLLEKIPLFLLAAASCAATSWAQDKAMFPLEYLPLGQRLGNAVVSYVSYLGMFLWPQGLAVMYPHPIGRLPTWEIIVALVVLVGISAAVFLLRRRFPYLLVGWLWYLGMLVPVIGVVQVGAQAMADRYSYLPQIGLAIAVVWGAADLFNRWPQRRWIPATVAVLVMIALMMVAWRQTTFWRDSETLWRRTLACTSRNRTAHGNLGAALSLLGRYGEAVEQQRIAVSLNPRNVRGRVGLGVAMVRNGEIYKAEAEFREALRMDPECTDARSNLAGVLQMQGRVEDSLRAYQELLKSKPDATNALNGIAWIRATAVDARLRDGAEAVRYARLAAAASPDDPNVLDTLAAAYAEAGRFTEAVQTIDRALRAISSRNEAKLAGDLRRRLALYQSGQPYRDVPKTQQ